MSIKYEFKGTGLSVSEGRWAKRRFDNYRKNHTIEGLGDLQLLEELVYRETIQERYKTKIAEFSKARKRTDSTESYLDVVPSKLLESLNENSDYIIKIMDKIGLFSDRNKDVDPLKYINDVKNKQALWRKENQASRTRVCPFCAKMILFKVRVDKYEAIKHPFFKDKILTNEWAWQLYKENKISKLDLAKILLGTVTTSTDYIDWLEEKIYKPAIQPVST